MSSDLKSLRKRCWQSILPTATWDCTSTWKLWKSTWSCYEFVRGSSPGHFCKHKQLGTISRLVIYYDPKVAQICRRCLPQIRHPHSSPCTRWCMLWMRSMQSMRSMRSCWCWRSRRLHKAWHVQAPWCMDGTRVISVHFSWASRQLHMFEEVWEQYKGYRCSWLFAMQSMRTCIKARIWACACDALDLALEAPCPMIHHAESAREATRSDLYNKCLCKAREYLYSYTHILIYCNYAYVYIYKHT